MPVLSITAMCAAVILRLILTMLLGFSALVPHCALAARSAEHHGRDHHAPSHDATPCDAPCLGCIAPQRRIAAAAPVAAQHGVAPPATRARALRSLAAHPEPPPPRSPA